MGSSPRSIQSLLHTATPDIADLLGRARFLARIRAAMLEILPPQAEAHIQVAGYDHYRLRLHVTHGGWATRLRYMEPAIRQALAQRMRLHIEGVEVRVRPESQSRPAPSGPRPMSAATRRHIRQMASYVSDNRLADALEKLARAGRDAADAAP